MLKGDKCERKRKRKLKTKKTEQLKGKIYTKAWKMKAKKEGYNTLQQIAREEKCFFQTGGGWILDTVGMHKFTSRFF